jgi:hypothetical protein
MRQNIIAIMATVAAFAASTEFVNAQSNSEVQVINNLTKKASVWKLSEGEPAKNDAISAASAHTYIFDCKKFQIEAPISETDSLIAVWQEEQIRNVTNGVAFGVDAGGVMLADNFSPAAGFHVTMSWKKIDITGGFLAATNKYNEESTKAGQRFFAGMAYGELGYNVRFKMRGYNNQGVFVPFVGYMFIFDKNANDISETIAVNGGTLTYDGMSNVKGNSSAIYGGVKARFSLKHMGRTAITVKAFGGVYQRYYLEGSKRKPFAGVTIGLEFSGAKKRTDADVKALRTSLENGDYRLANEVINNLRANMK